MQNTLTFGSEMAHLYWKYMTFLSYIVVVVIKFE